MHTDLIKWIHILSATILFGTGLGTAYFKWTSDRLSDIATIHQINQLVVAADWLFTTPAIVIQAITGVLLIQSTGYSFNEPWLLLSISLFFLAGTCWLPVVYLQIRMCHLSSNAVTNQQPLQNGYHQLARYWFWLGVPAFSAVVGIFYLMVAKPLS